MVASYPSSNVFDVTITVDIPSTCPVPLKSPGTETKRAGAIFLDQEPQSFDEGRLVVRNSAGEVVADERTPFFQQYTLDPAPKQWLAAPVGDYVAATGTKQVSDHDLAEFSGWRFGQRNAYGTIKITYKPSSIATSISGEKIPMPNTTHTWSAPTSGGVPAYMYQWYLNGDAVGTGASYTAAVGTSDFNLRVEVMDQAWSTVAAVFPIDVGGVETTLTGPSTAYSSTNGASWSASGRGGTGQYTFDWYLDGEFLGSGPTWDGYPGERGHTLRVDMTDSAGAFDSQSLFVVGIGSGTGTCEPFPPALRC